MGAATWCLLTSGGGRGRSHLGCEHHWGRAHGNLVRARLVKSVRERRGGTQDNLAIAQLEGIGHDHLGRSQLRGIVQLWGIAFGVFYVYTVWLPGG